MQNTHILIKPRLRDCQRYVQKLFLKVIVICLYISETFLRHSVDCARVKTITAKSTEHSDMQVSKKLTKSHDKDT